MPSFADTYVYWKTSNLNKIHTFEELLQNHANDIRYEIQQLGTLGKIPKISFMNYQEGLSVPTAEELQEIIKHQYEKSQESNDSLYEIEPSENDSSDAYDCISRLEKKSDALGFDRKSALEKIVKSIELDRLYKSRNKNET